MDLQRIVSEILASGLSQAELAERLAVEQPTVSRYLRGETKVCGYPIGVRLMRLHKRCVKGARQ